MSRGLLLASLLLAPACATTTTTTVEPLGPNQLSGAEPEAAAIVILRLKIDANGAVRDAQVVQSAGRDFDDAALKAVYRLHFNPAEKDGQPVESTIRFAFSF
jgi:periplasmic protein TonB